MTTHVTQLDTATVQHLQSWVDKTETLHDDISLAPVRGFSVTLDRDDPMPASGTPVPPLAHWFYFLPQHMQSEIGPDGHAKRGGFLPPVPLPRRMWAGSRLHWQVDNPLRVGDAVTRVSRIASVTHKAGRTGDLLFVVVRHEISNAQGLALSDEHDIVYRPAAQAGEGEGRGEVAPAPVAARTDALWQREILGDPVLLFRYSALTFNGHRIHYDRSYVTEVEGYPGLIVHGPLIATLLVDLVRRHCPDAPIRHFQFKAVRPTFDLHPFHVNARPTQDPKVIDVWASDHEGWLTMPPTNTKTFATACAACALNFQTNITAESMNNAPTPRRLSTH